MLKLKENVINLKDALLEVIISRGDTYRDANEALDMVKSILTCSGQCLLDDMKAQEIIAVDVPSVTDKKPEDYVGIDLPMPHGAP